MAEGSSSQESNKGQGEISNDPRLEQLRSKPKEVRVEDLMRLRRSEVHLPIIMQKKLTPEQEDQLKQEINSLTDEQLNESIIVEEDRLKEETYKQRPRGLAMP